MRIGFPLVLSACLVVLSACTSAPDERSADPAPNLDVPSLESDVELTKDDDPDDSPRHTCGRWCTDRLFACEDGCDLFGSKFFMPDCKKSCDDDWGVCQRQCKILFPL